MEPTETDTSPKMFSLMSRVPLPKSSILASPPSCAPNSKEIVPGLAIKVASPAPESLEKTTDPLFMINTPLPAVATSVEPSPNSIRPPSTIKVPSAALEFPWKLRRLANSAVKVPFPALELSPKATIPPEFASGVSGGSKTNVPLPALAVSEKDTNPPLFLFPWPPLTVKKVISPTVALLVRTTPAKIEQTKFWATPELFIIPMPLIVNSWSLAMLILKGLAPVLKITSLTSTDDETKTLVCCESPNVAMSSGPSGTVFGVQLSAVFQSLLI